MPSFSIVRKVPLRPDQAWQRLTAWEAHGDSVPFTTVTQTASGILARTKIGPLTIDDPMDLQILDPPRRFVAVKTGAVVKGKIEMSIEPVTASASDSGAEKTSASSRVVWQQWLTVSGMPALTEPVVVLMCKLMYGRLLRRLLRTDSEA